jgi:hypothetical protein
MKLEEYKSNIRKYRGHLASMDDALEEIHTSGCEEFIEFTLSTKAIGVGKMAMIATSLSHHQQQIFLVWMSLEKRTANQISLKLLELI